MKHFFQRAVNSHLTSPTYPRAFLSSDPKTTSLSIKASLLSHLRHPNNASPNPHIPRISTHPPNLSLPIPCLCLCPDGSKPIPTMSRCDLLPSSKLHILSISKSSPFSSIPISHGNTT